MSFNKSIKKLDQQLAELKQHLSEPSVSKPEVSKVDSHWHVQHTITVLDMILNALRNSEISEYKPKFSVPKSIIFTTGFIPRGKGKAPKRVLTDEVKSAVELLNTIDNTSDMLTEVSKTVKELCFKHPLFGWLNTKDTLRFLVIHNHHHLKIVRDIKRT